MPNNVKSYKKIDEKAQTAKITVFAMGSQLLGAKNTQNSELFPFHPQSAFEFLLVSI